jgi:hypothetical protein
MSSFLDSAKQLASTVTGNNNYLQEGRHIVRVSKMFFVEPDLSRNKMNPTFNIDAEVLISPRHGRSEFVRANDSFKIPAQGMSRMLGAVSVAKSVLTGKNCSPSDLGLEKPSDAEFAAELRRLLGAEQPLSGAIVAIVATTGTSKKGTQYTLYNVRVPTDDEIQAVLALD